MSMESVAFALKARAVVEHMKWALECADRAINPDDKSGISLYEWNKRLKSVTFDIKEAVYQAANFLHVHGQPAAPQAAKVEAIDAKDEWSDFQKIEALRSSLSLMTMYAEDYLEMLPPSCGRSFHDKEAWLEHLIQIGSNISRANQVLKEMKP